MSNTAWKIFERHVAALIKGNRFWSNSGCVIDVEGPLFLAQCKLVKNLSLSALTDLALIAKSQGKAKGKVGLVAVKCRRGAGYPTPVLIVMVAEGFEELANEEAV